MYVLLKFLKFYPLYLEFALFIIAIVTSCSTLNIRRVFYRFNYSSSNNNIISTVEAYILTQASAVTNPRITIEWNDIANNSASSATIPGKNSFSSVIQ